MTSTFGKNIVTTIFGESHGHGIGVVIDGLPAGQRIDLEELSAFLMRRAPGQSAYTTERKEQDEPVFLSGILDGVLTGSPLSAVIYNKDQRSKDYSNLRDMPRPSHADWNAHVKYKGHMDMRGGGPFSGRITAPLSIAGGIAKQILKSRGIYVGAHLAEVAGIPDTCWDKVHLTEEDLSIPGQKDFPTLSEDAAAEIKSAIQRARDEQNSVGGIIECAAIGLPQGLGSPNYGGVESRLSHVLFSVPAVRGVSFGTGFPATRMTGRDHNDEYQIVDGQVRTVTNHAGGVVGGITNGMPLIFQVAIKPTSSIGLPQQSFSIAEMVEKTLEVVGRHDPCIAVRAVPVIEAACALVLLDLMEDENGFRSNQK